MRQIFAFLLQCEFVTCGTELIGGYEMEETDSVCVFEAPTNVGSHVGTKQQLNLTLFGAIFQTDNKMKKQ